MRIVASRGNVQDTIQEQFAGAEARCVLEGSFRAENSVSENGMVFEACGLSKGCKTRFRDAGLGLAVRLRLQRVAGGSLELRRCVFTARWSR